MSVHPIHREWNTGARRRHGATRSPWPPPQGLLPARDAQRRPQAEGLSFRHPRRWRCPACPTVQGGSTLFIAGGAHERGAGKALPAMLYVLDNRRRRCRCRAAPRLSPRRTRRGRHLACRAGRESRRPISTTGSMHERGTGAMHPAELHALDSRRRQTCRRYGPAQRRLPGHGQFPRHARRGRCLGHRAGKGVCLPRSPLGTHMSGAQAQRHWRRSSAAVAAGMDRRGAIRAARACLSAAGAARRGGRGREPVHHVHRGWHASAQRSQDAAKGAARSRRSLPPSLATSMDPRGAIHWTEACLLATGLVSHTVQGRRVGAPPPPPGARMSAVAEATAFRGERGSGRRITCTAGGRHERGADTALHARRPSPPSTTPIWICTAPSAERRVAFPPCAPKALSRTSGRTRNCCTLFTAGGSHERGVSMVVSAVLYVLDDHLRPACRRHGPHTAVRNAETCLPAAIDGRHRPARRAEQEGGVPLLLLVNRISTARAWRCQRCLTLSAAVATGRAASMDLRNAISGAGICFSNAPAAGTALRAGQGRGSAHHLHRGRHA